MSQICQSFQFLPSNYLCNINFSKSYQTLEKSFNISLKHTDKPSSMSFMRNLEETIFHLVSNNVRSWTHDSIKNTKVYTVINPKRESAACMYLTWQAVEQQKTAAGVNKTQPSQTHTDLDRFCQHSQLCLCFNKQTGQTPAGLCLRDTRGAARGREASKQGQSGFLRESKHTDQRHDSELTHGSLRDDMRRPKHL